MLINLRQLLKRELQAEDGPLGRTHDFLFDDRLWVVRYLVADTASWLAGRKVLISPYFFGDPVGGDPERFPVNLSRERIRNSPGLEEHLPVSRRYEQELARYYSYPVYWGAGPDLWGFSPFPILTDTVEEHERVMEDIHRSHLRSTGEVTGYRLQATDGAIGQVYDFIFDSRSWAIRYLVIDTRRWLPGRRVLISPSWIHAVEWSAREVRVAMSQDAIKGSPVYDATQMPAPDYERQLHAHYRPPGAV